MARPALVADGAALGRGAAVAAPPRLGVATAASAGLHVLGIALLVLRFHSAGLPAETPLEVEMIDTAAMQQGAAAQPAREATAPTDEAVLPAPVSPPQVNLGGGPQSSEALTVTGENIVPPAPDARYRNQPPHYPAEAARAGAEGTVTLLIHVSATGAPVGVEVGRSSGHASLDQAALEAVRRWRFKPAQRAGRAVPFDYLLNIRFALGDHP